MPVPKFTCPSGPAPSHPRALSLRTWAVPSLCSPLARLSCSPSSCAKPRTPNLQSSLPPTQLWGLPRAPSAVASSPLLCTQILLTSRPSSQLHTRLTPSPSTGSWGPAAPASIPFLLFLVSPFQKEFLPSHLVPPILSHHRYHLTHTLLPSQLLSNLTGHGLVGTWGSSGPGVCRWDRSSKKDVVVSLWLEKPSASLPLPPNFQNAGLLSCTPQSSLSSAVPTESALESSSVPPGPDAPSRPCLVSVGESAFSF